MFNILYVEDDNDSRTVMRLAQRMYPNDFKVTIFDDSEAFYERLKSLNPQPDLILLDIHLTPYTGFDMLEMIRSDAHYDDTPVVACTASVMNEEIEILKEAGFQGVISKPLNMEGLPGLFDKIMDGNTVWYVW